MPSATAASQAPSRTPASASSSVPAQTEATQPPSAWDAATAFGIAPRSSSWRTPAFPSFQPPPGTTSRSGSASGVHIENQQPRSILFLIR